ncbi:hypothetical protein R1sor_009483 [Riccia sorocarpa]|uniref:C2 domain-containing protein n=1 Tax=Riccia sorocarpa TaxID=122646 RepID=A0ABD3HXZ5_9MARC
MASTAAAANFTQPRNLWLHFRVVPVRHGLHCRKLSTFSSKRVRLVFRAQNGRQISPSGWNRSLRDVRMERSDSSNTDYASVVSREQDEDSRPPFNLDLAVLLAGFAFESYNTPEKDEGIKEMDTMECETTYLAKEYIQALYDGQVSVKLKKGSNFPGLDLWSYVSVLTPTFVSLIITRTRDPVWNEEVKLNVRDPTSQTLKIAAWDANVVTAHRRLGNYAVNLDNLCDGANHELEVKLEGMGGGGTVYLEVQYKSFVQIEAEKSRGFDFASMFRFDALQKAFKSVVGDYQISVGDFMLSFYNPTKEDTESKPTPEAKIQTRLEDEGKKETGFEWNPFSRRSQEEATDKAENGKSLVVKETIATSDEVAYWRTMAEAVSEKLKPLGFDLSSFLPDWDGLKLTEDLKSVGFESQKKAEAEYIKEGLTFDETKSPQSTEETQGFGFDSLLRLGLSPLESVQSLRKQTENLLGVWTIFNKSLVPQLSDGKDAEKNLENGGTSGTLLPEKTQAKKANDEGLQKVSGDSYESYAAMFRTAESAMEAWALLATTLGEASLVKSDFQKLCFVDNVKTDTQAAVWRDQRRKRLVVAFRGTEQTKWKDLLTDLSMLGIGFNPERVGDGGTNEEVLVHGGFLTAYDSAKAKLLSIVRSAINLRENDTDSEYGSTGTWHIYATGHSLGGALATLFALDLASSKLAKDGQIHVTMYNYGSPRVGNKRFAEMYNKTVKDSWRIVNHRDIVPTVPRLMGYCHVAQPIYLTTYDTGLMSDLLDDGYRGDVIGEATPDVIIDEIMKGEQTVLQRLLDTEITMLRAMRDGSAVMQHMEDFYYITLLQRVEARISHSRK